MQTRILTMGAAIAALMLALMVARTAAFAGDSESCSETNANVTNQNVDRIATSA